MGDEFRISAKEVDVEMVMRQIKEQVERKQAAGVYDKYNLSALTVKDIAELQNEQDFLDYYLELIQHTCDIDIGDFTIPSKGGILGKPVARFKRFLWIILRFYTYRLFSQQKEFNFQLVNTLMSINKKLDEKVNELTGRLADLEKKYNKNL